MLQVNVHVHPDDGPVSGVKVITPGRTSLEQSAIELLIKKNYSFAVTGDAAITATDLSGATTQLTVRDLADGGFVIGRDYYIFATVENGESTYIMTQNKDLDANHLVGGFHFGKCRRTDENLQPVNAAGRERGDGWEANVYDGIVPRSMWTLARRPKCDPEGMVCLPSGVWVDIYQASDDGDGGLASVHGAMPLTSKNWYEFNEMAIAKGKRLLSYSEWCAMAIGSPQGLEDDNTNAWTAGYGHGKQKTGYVDNAVSSFGCRDAVGNVWEWLDAFTSDPDGGEWKWWDKMPGHGQLFMAGSTGLAALLAGGGWGNGVRAGCRAVNLSNDPWRFNAFVGARCACDAL